MYPGNNYEGIAQIIALFKPMNDINNAYSYLSDGEKAIRHRRMPMNKVSLHHLIHS